MQNKCWICKNEVLPGSGNLETSRQSAVHSSCDSIHQDEKNLIRANKKLSELSKNKSVSRSRPVSTSSMRKTAKKLGANSLYCGCAMCRSGRESLCLREGN